MASKVYIEVSVFQLLVLFHIELSTSAASILAKLFYSQI